MNRKLFEMDAPGSDYPQRPGTKPGDYELGSLESRAAARARLQRSAMVTAVVVFTGLPRPSGLTPIVEPPDTLSYYEARDGSIVEVICRQSEPGKFTAHIDQTWRDGSVYRGDVRVNALADLAKLCRRLPRKDGTVVTGSGHYA